MQIPPTSILTLDPLYCSYSTLRVVLACKSATRHAATFRHFCQPPSSPSSCQQTFHNSLPQGQASISSSAFQSQPERQWPQDRSQGHRHHLLLPKALPQGNLSRYFDLACITAGLRCLAGQQDAWEDAWLVLNHALGNYAQEGQRLVSLHMLISPQCRDAFFCPQTFLSLDFQCRDDVSESKQKFRDQKELAFFKEMSIVALSRLTSN